MSRDLHTITPRCVVCRHELNGGEAIEVEGGPICGATKCAATAWTRQRRLARAPSGAFHEHLVGRACAGCGMPEALHSAACEVA